MMTRPKAPIGVVDGEVVFNKALTPKPLIVQMKRELVLRKRAFRPDQASKFLEFYTDAFGSFSVPRSFGIGKALTGNLQVEDKTTTGEPFEFKFEGGLRDDQPQAFDAAVAALRSPLMGGVVKAPCGSGKTVLGLAIIAEMGVKAVILLHKQPLMDQWKARIKTFLGFEDVGIVKGQKAEWDKPIVLASIQTLIKRSDLGEQVAKFGLVITDEMHHIAAEKFRESLKHFPARYRLGLTATPRRGDGLEPALFWGMGDVIAEMEGPHVTADVYMVMHDVDLPDWVFFDNGDGPFNRDAYTTWIGRLHWRNQVALRYIFDAIDSGRRILVLSDRVAHLQKLYEPINEKIGKGVVLFTDKKATGTLAEASEAQVILSTYGMLSEGFDVEAMDSLFLLTPRSDVEQSVGRVVRSCGEKKRPTVIDFVDLDSHSYMPNGENSSKLAEMARRRVEWYRSCGHTVVFKDRRTR